MAEPDHRANDRRRLRVTSEVDHERAVDLDLVERKCLKIAQRRITAAEIVHGNAHAKRLQTSQQRQAALEILDQHAFGDFQFQPARREAGFEKYGMHEADEIAVHELRRRQVDSDLQRHRPGGRLLAGFAQYPFAHLDDQAAFFRERNEIPG